MEHPPFSAHADRMQMVGLIEALHPHSVVSCMGISMGGRCRLEYLGDLA